MGRKVVICFIFATGLFLRFQVFNTQHPHKDEFFQLQALQTKSLPDVLKKNQFYGDHTSFPGEFLLHYIPMKLSGIFGHPVEVNLAKGEVVNYSHTRKWALASPHIIISIVGLFAFYLLCKIYLVDLGILIACLILAFNSGVVFFDFEFRPYGVLQELFIFNLLISHWFIKKENSWGIIRRSGYFSLFFLTCIYHAYGILIAFLPLFYNAISQRKAGALKTWPIVFLISQSLLAWGYYASYNTFGFHANAIQAVVDPYQYMPKDKMFTVIISQLFGNDLLLAALWPVVFLSLFGAKRLFFICLIALPLALIVLVDLKTSYWIHQRQYLWVVPAFAIYCGIAVESLNAVVQGCRK